MKRKKTWMAVCERALGTFEAQGDSSFSDLVRRLKKDDPVWKITIVRREYVRKWGGRAFKRGLAIRFRPNAKLTGPCAGHWSNE